MKYLFIYFLLTVLPLHGEVISYGDDYIRYDVPDDWLRKVSVRTDFREYLSSFLGVSFKACSALP